MVADSDTTTHATASENDVALAASVVLERVQQLCAELWRAYFQPLMDSVAVVTANIS